MLVNFVAYAKISIEEIIEFLELKWTEREIDFFFDEIDRLIKTIEDGIIKYPFYKQTKIQKAFIVKGEISVFFHQKSQNEVDFILFFPNKKDPQQLKNLLK